MYWDFSRFDDTPALIADTGVTITYRGLASLSEEAEAAAGRHAGGDSGQKPLVMLVCRNSLGALAGYAALASVGCARAGRACALRIGATAIGA